jgi:hypothetical protein
MKYLYGTLGSIVTLLAGIVYVVDRDIETALIFLAVAILCKLGVIEENTK